MQTNLTLQLERLSLLQAIFINLNELIYNRLCRAPLQKVPLLLLEAEVSSNFSLYDDDLRNEKFSRYNNSCSFNPLPVDFNGYTSMPKHISFKILILTSQLLLQLWMRAGRQEGWSTWPRSQSGATLPQWPQTISKTRAFGSTQIRCFFVQVWSIFGGRCLRKSSWWCTWVQRWAAETCSKSASTEDGSQLLSAIKSLWFTLSYELLLNGF